MSQTRDMNQDGSPVVAELQAAAQGLTYPSDSDEPFDAFEWESTGALSVKDHLAGHGGNGRAIEDVPIDSFFEQLDDSDDAERYHQLRKSLESLLSGLKVFRVGTGEVRVDIYLIGITQNGKLGGLHTISIET